MNKILIIIACMVVWAIISTDSFMTVANFIHDTKCSIADAFCY